MPLGSIKKYWAGIVVVAILLLTIILQIQQRFFPHVSTVTFNNKKYTVLLATTENERVQGLSDRESLGAYDGMLFVFSTPENYTMVMRRMRFPLDIVWINNGRVVDLKENLSPEPDRREGELTPYSSAFLATFVLEVPAGFTRTNGIKIGDSVQIAL